jgi:putative copper resistance protein D
VDHRLGRCLAGESRHPVRADPPDIRAASLADVVDPAGAWSFLSGEAIGHVFLWQSAGVVAAIVLSTLGSSPWLRRLAAVLAVGASAAPALLGHSGDMEGHVGATVSLALHIAAVSMWVGGLAVTVGLLRIDGRLAPVLAPRFSLLALWCVIVIAETGLLNASLRVGTASALVSTPYGALVIAKAVLFAALVRLGWLQRQHSLADLGARPAASVRSLVRYASWEFCAMGVAVALSVALSRIGPPPSAATSGAFSPLAVLCLALAAPLLLTWCWTPGPGRAWVRRLRAYPEVWAVVLLFVVIETAGVGLFTTMLGPDAGAVVGSVALLLAGSAWAVAVSDARGPGAVIVMLAGWPLVGLVVFALTDGDSGWRSALVSVVVGEALLLLLLRSGGQRAAWATRPAVASEKPPVGGPARHG